MHPPALPQTDYNECMPVLLCYASCVLAKSVITAGANASCFQRCCYRGSCCVQVALTACREAAGSVEEIAFILFSGDTFSAWREAAEAMQLQPL